MHLSPILTNHRLSEKEGLLTISRQRFFDHLIVILMYYKFYLFSTVLYSELRFVGLHHLNKQLC